MVGSQPINGSDKSSSLVLCTNLERPTMSDNMMINRLRFGFHRSDNRFQNSVPVLALVRILIVSGCISIITGDSQSNHVVP